MAGRGGVKSVSSSSRPSRTESTRSSAAQVEEVAESTGIYKPPKWLQCPCLRNRPGIHSAIGRTRSLRTPVPWARLNEVKVCRPLGEDHASDPGHRPARGCCVRLRQGDYDRETVFGDDPAAMAAHWEAEGATRIHLVDLDGAKAGRPVNVEAVRGDPRPGRVPCQLGGGIRDEATIAAWLDAGLERVIVGTQALKDPGLVPRDGRGVSGPARPRPRRPRRPGRDRGLARRLVGRGDDPGRAVRRPAAGRGRLHRHRARRDARGAEPGRHRGAGRRV